MMEGEKNCDNHATTQTDATPPEMDSKNAIEETVALLVRFAESTAVPMRIIGAASPNTRKNINEKNIEGQPIQSVDSAIEVAEGAIGIVGETVKTDQPVQSGDSGIGVAEGAIGGVGETEKTDQPVPAADSAIAVGATENTVKNRPVNNPKTVRADLKKKIIAGEPSQKRRKLNPPIVIDLCEDDGIEESSSTHAADPFSKMANEYIPFISEPSPNFGGLYGVNAPNFGGLYGVNAETGINSSNNERSNEQLGQRLIEQIQALLAQEHHRHLMTLFPYFTTILQMLVNIQQLFSRDPTTDRKSPEHTNPTTDLKSPEYTSTSRAVSPVSPRAPNDEDDEDEDLYG